MARGKSGRVVLEIDPEEKQRLYLALELEGKTLKQWFLEQATETIGQVNRQSLKPFLEKDASLK